MIYGVGTDLIEINRVKQACEKEAFLKKCFTQQEMILIRSKIGIAADNFAVKEAVAKMFGTGFRGIWLTDIEVLRDELGKPYVNLYGKAKVLAEEIGLKQVHVTISNTRDYAMAFAVGEC